MSAAIEETISSHNKILVSVLKQLEDLYSKYACVEPEDVRNSYDTMHGIIEKKTTEIKERKEYIKKCIKDLEKCNEPIAEMEKVLKKIGKTSNRGRVGTLHGLCKQTIKEHKIPMDEIEEMVSNFPYDEKNEIEKSKKSASRGKKSASHGGKRNNTKRKSYKAKNGNNKSKK